MDDQNNDERTAEQEASEPKAAAPRRSRSRRATSPAKAPEAAAEAPEQTAGGTGSGDDAPAAGTDAPAAEASATEVSADATAESPPEKPKRTRKAPAKRTTTKTTADATAAAASGTEAATQVQDVTGEATEAVAEKAAEAAAEKPKRTRKAPARRTTKKAAEADPAATAAATDKPAAATEEPATTDEPAAPVAESTARPSDSGTGRTDIGLAEAGPTDAGTTAANITDAGTDAGGTDGDAELAAAPARRRSRRASAPTRSPEQKLDVFAELGVAAAETTSEPAEPAVAESADEPEEETAAEDVATAASPDTGAEEPEEGPRLAATALLFQAPDPSKARPRRRRAQAPAGEPVVAEEPATDEKPTRTKQADRKTDEPAEPVEETEESDDEQTGGEDERSGGRRRRRRGGRGRRNRGGQTDGTDDSDDEGEGEGERPTSTATEDRTETDAEADESQGEDTEGEEGQSSSRRRRRRRRSGSGGGRGEAESAGRSARDEVTALKGSTRLEAKRQRRREGREAGRRRPTLSESEFLARREAVERKMVVREKDGLNQIAVLEDGILVEHYVAAHTQTSMVGNVYLGRVQNVLPSMEAAFVDLGKGRNAVLYAGEVNWDAAGMEGQPRRIEQALKSGDSVLVQVTKDPIGHKGARLTSQITLAGRHLVLVPSGAMTGISRKLPDNERARLKKLLKEIVPEGSGVIVRTAAEGASEEQLRADVERLTKQWADIEAKAKGAKSAPLLLKGEPELAVRVVRDVFNEDFESLVVSGSTAWQTISTYVKDLSPDLADRMHHWTSENDVFAEYRVDEQLAKGMDRKVWLPSGGSLVIDRTEAMTVVDVNTGKFTGSGGTLEETVTRNNIEAAEEIVRQLRLRDIGGIIVIDFIDMVLESNRDLVMRRLLECLGRDRTRHQVAEVTSLGLVQMTRKRVGQGLVEAFSTPCEHCNGRGFIVHNEPVEKSGSGESHQHDDGGSSGRRRGRRGGSNAPAEPSSPDEAPAAEDPAAVAAREAVKATLATIAAAAASAHEEGGHKDEVRAETAAAEQPSAGEPSEKPAASGEAPQKPAARSRRRKAEAPAGPVAPVQSGADETGAAGSEPGVAAPAPELIKEAAPVRATGVIGGASVSAEAGDGATGTEKAASAATDESAAAAPARRPRRSRRAVSSGVVTPGETKIVTIEPGADQGDDKR
ncbi:Rne/Rng family ribonuclease [Georgenia subflava]|uniref:Ribonuclease E n=1 Tax=Georgenia subflava TaxID=1622177 RepID=A0A6N7EDY2_9MICO|nr:Rne/Rng family ribonuclease [Georgenia subflava]MPV36220.1 Rne/Rng family ribonuclease [Georgenia subflava]